MWDQNSSCGLLRNVGGCARRDSRSIRSSNGGGSGYSSDQLDWFCVSDHLLTAGKYMRPNTNRVHAHEPEGGLKRVHEEDLKR